MLPGCNNNYMAFFAQDDWHVTRQLTLNLGLRYDLDTNSKDLSYYSQINPAGTAVPARHARQRH